MKGKIFKLTSTVLLFFIIVIKPGDFENTNIQQSFNTRQITFRSGSQKCRITQYFDKKEGRCLGIPGGGKFIRMDPKKSCGMHLLKPHCSNSRYYYVCKDNFAILAKCVDNQQFENRFQRCVTVLAKSLDVQILTPEEENVENIHPPPCKILGRFPVPNHCNLFYTCESNGHWIFQNVYKCPENQRYNADGGICTFNGTSENCLENMNEVCAPVATFEATSTDSVEMSEEKTHLELPTDVTVENATDKLYYSANMITEDSLVDVTDSTVNVELDSLDNSDGSSTMIIPVSSSDESLPSSTLEVNISSPSTEENEWAESVTDSTLDMVENQLTRAATEPTIYSEQQSVTDFSYSISTLPENTETSTDELEIGNVDEDMSVTLEPSEFVTTEPVKARMGEDFGDSTDYLELQNTLNVTSSYDQIYSNKNTESTDILYNDVTTETMIYETTEDNSETISSTPDIETEFSVNYDNFLSSTENVVISTNTELNLANEELPSDLEIAVTTDSVEEDTNQSDPMIAITTEYPTNFEDQSTTADTVNDYYSQSIDEPFDSLSTSNDTFSSEIDESTSIVDINTESSTTDAAIEVDYVATPSDDKRIGKENLRQSGPITEENINDFRKDFVTKQKQIFFGSAESARNHLLITSTLTNISAIVERGMRHIFHNLPKKIIW